MQTLLYHEVDLRNDSAESVERFAESGVVLSTGGSYIFQSHANAPPVWYSVTLISICGTTLQ